MHDSALDFIGDMRNHLNRFAQIVAMSFLVNDRFVNSPRSHGISACGADAREAFVVTQVEIGFHPVHGDVTFAVLVWIERSRVNVDVGVELLDGNGVAAGLEQLSDAGRNNALP